MAVFFYKMEIVSRSSNSVVKQAAYCSGTKLSEHLTGIEYTYLAKTEVVYSDIMLPANAPKEYAEREILWNAIDKVEKRIDAQLAREIIIALPRELSRDKQIELLIRHVKETFVDKGMCADINIHDLGNGNPHGHVLLTMRAIDDRGKWCPKSRSEYILDDHGDRIPLVHDNDRFIMHPARYKTRKISYTDWDDRCNIEKWREAWATLHNSYLDKEYWIDWRSYERQGIDRIPHNRESVIAHNMSEAGKLSEVAQENLVIDELNEIHYTQNILLRKKETLLKEAFEKEMVVDEYSRDQQTQIGIGIDDQRERTPKKTKSAVESIASQCLTSTAKDSKIQEPNTYEVERLQVRERTTHPNHREPSILTDSIYEEPTNREDKDDSVLRHRVWDDFDELSK